MSKLFGRRTVEFCNDIKSKADFLLILEVDGRFSLPEGKYVSILEEDKIAIENEGYKFHFEEGPYEVEMIGGERNLWRVCEISKNNF